MVEARSLPGPGRVQSFRLKSGNPALGEESLRYAEAAELVRTALSGRGWYEAPSEERAEAIVEIEFGMQARRPAGSGQPETLPPGGELRRPRAAEVEARGNAPRGLTGREEPPRAGAPLQKFLLVTARGAKPAGEGQPPAELWQVRVTAEDESNDLRKYLPMMASVVADHLGRDSGGPVAVRMREDGAAVDFIRRGMGGPTPALAEPARR